MLLSLTLTDNNEYRAGYSTDWSKKLVTTIFLNSIHQFIDTRKLLIGGITQEADKWNAF